VITPYIGGSPTEKVAQWTHLKKEEIQNLLKSVGFMISIYTISRLLCFFNYRKRSLQKVLCDKAVENRNEQFEYIAQVKELFLSKSFPVLSIDSKNKELIGNFYRKGSYYGVEGRKVNDHDFKSLATAQITPHGIYDEAKNIGYLNLGTSKDTSEFVCDNIEKMWTQYLQFDYDHSDTILITCDGGGSNNANHYIVKYDLYRLAQKLQMNLLIMHYPPYCSKWNPIEHRLFCHVSRSWDGQVLDSLQTALDLCAKTSTKKGLKVFAHINPKTYLTKRVVPQYFKDNINDFVHFDEKLPKLNYLIRYKPL
jgi:hypothetical protein